jgi:hypothetical protein
VTVPNAAVTNVAPAVGIMLLAWAPVLLLLESPLADFVSGASLSVDGGSDAGRSGVRPTADE